MMARNAVLKKLAVAAVVAAGAFAAPAMSSAATAIPPLQSGDTQAYLSMTPGGAPAAATIGLSGAVTIVHTSMPLTITCNTSLTVDPAADGTAMISAASFTNCVAGGVSDCTVTFTPRDVPWGPTNLPWGGRLVRNGGIFRRRYTPKLVMTYSGPGCPWGPQSFTGTFSPVLNGSPVTGETFDAASGTLSNPLLGSYTLSGTLTKTSGPTVYPGI